MNLKQRFSVATAAVLPVLALCGYLCMTPAKAHAITSCPDGGIYAPVPDAPPEPVLCSNGAGGSVAEGDTGSFTFCGTGENSMGTCEAGSCVKCSD
ncbi:hypothetical protein GCM10011586_25160 [Silvibacterium dinghuense]|nr:hypothetical protein GCM10011586_25160 [Silvibacterium dinghuense]